MYLVSTVTKPRSDKVLTETREFDTHKEADDWFMCVMSVVFVVRAEIVHVTNGTNRKIRQYDCELGFAS